MKDKIFQIQIVLRGSKPKIWRRLLIPSYMLLPDFHEVIQITFGWKNLHLHRFIKDHLFYTVKMEDDDFFGETNYRDSKNITVSYLLSGKHDKIMYEYDYGDRWEHDILLEEINFPEPDKKYPVCIDGELSCPPDDCGGIHAYHELLSIIKNPEHKYYENYKDWLEVDFDPGYFNIEETNKKLNSWVK